jgi:hypothetical protein
MFPLIGNIATLWRGDFMQDGRFVLSTVNMHFRLGEIRNSSRVIAVEMRQQEMSDVVW